MITTECSLLAGGWYGHNDRGLATQTLHGGGKAHPGTLQQLLSVRSWSRGPWCSCRCFPYWRTCCSCWWSSSCGGFRDATPTTPWADCISVYLVTKQREEPCDTGASATLFKRNIKCGTFYWFFLLWFLLFYNLHCGSGLCGFHNFFIFVFRCFIFLVALIIATALILFWYDKLIRRGLIIKYFLCHTASEVRLSKIINI